MAGLLKRGDHLDGAVVEQFRVDAVLFARHFGAQADRGPPFVGSGVAFSQAQSPAHALRLAGAAEQFVDELFDH
jgi:hypothetical protein